jgi:hypothetical protein
MKRIWMKLNLMVQMASKFECLYGASFSFPDLIFCNTMMKCPILQKHLSICPSERIHQGWYATIKTKQSIRINYEYLPAYRK